MSALDEIIETLATKIRVMTSDQVAETWYGDAARPTQSAKAAFRRLESQGLLETKWAMAHPRISIEAPSIGTGRTRKHPRLILGDWHGRQNVGFESASIERSLPAP